MIYSVHQPQYLPWLGFFDKVDKSDVFVFLDDVQYKHREFQNRNKIRTKDGWIWLSVPVFEERGMKIKDIRIDPTRSWAEGHLKSLKSWYAKAPYFDRHIGFFESLFAKKRERLVDLNVAVIEYVLGVLGIKKKVFFETELSAGGEKSQRIVNIGKKIGANIYLSGAGGKDYLDEGLFHGSDIALEYQDYAHPVYRQQFMKSEKDFMPYLSVVDLLFNEGDASGSVIRRGGRHV
jgi:hypothetical protein